MSYSKDKSVMRKRRFRKDWKHINSSGVVNSTGFMEYTAGAWEDYRWSWGYRPNWKTLVKQGLDATTKLEAAKLKFKLSTGLFDQTLSDHSRSIMWGHLTANLMTTYDGVVKSLPALELIATSRAQTSFVKNIRNASRSWDGGQFLGELKQSFDLVKHPLNALADSLQGIGHTMSKIRHGTSKWKSVDRLKAYSDAWLTYAFGAKPLYSDVKNATDALRKSVSENKRQFDIQRLIGEGEAADVSSSIQTISMNPSGFPNSYCVADLYIEDKVTVRYIGGYKSYNPSEAMPVFRETGLDPTNWVPTLYEVCPWSWALDMFTNCGDVIDAYSCRLKGLVWCVETIRVSRTVKLSPCRPGPNAQLGKVTVAYGGGGSSKSTYVLRQHHDNVWTPNLLFRIPGLSQGLNLAAAMGQMKKLRKMKW